MHKKKEGEELTTSNAFTWTSEVVIAKSNPETEH
jgi:hypothetical protein